MILKLRINLYPGAGIRLQMYNKLYEILDLFYGHPRYTLQTLTINISYKVGYKRHYFYLLTCSLKSEEDIRMILDLITDKCIRKEIELESLDRLFIQIISDRERGV